MHDITTCRLSDMATALHAPSVTAKEIVAPIPYTVDTGEKLVNETFGPGNIHLRKAGTHELRQMTVRNGRPVANSLSLDTHGFVFVEHKTKVSDFLDEAQLKGIYYKEVEQLIKNAAGASRVMVFDHTLRSGDATSRETKLLREPVLSAHNDYTEWSGPNRLREFLPDEADRLLARRFAIIQVWRAINQPIRSAPLAIADARSIDPQDLLTAERRYPHRVGQTYHLKHNPNHRWFYFPEMRRDEALVFKVYESEKEGRARFVPHTAFDDPGSPSGAPPRESIEVRAFAFF
jgi:hypothetical protein